MRSYWFGKVQCLLGHHDFGIWHACNRCSAERYR